MTSRIAAVLLTTALFHSLAPVATACPAPADPVRFVGTWNVKAHTPDGLYVATLVVQEGEEGLEGSLTYESAPWGIKFKSAKVEESTLSFEFNSPDGYQRVSVTVDGDTLKGTSEIGGYGTVELEGTRRPVEPKG